ncbi:hypothetical protein [Dyadobacter sp. BHUBP1]|uniref:hypothetical protein n=1 Tax=Dyadobacter sp. BHUBP1 TaxID=3424178 RepID=UPI003D33D290
MASLVTSLLIGALAGWLANNVLSRFSLSSTAQLLLCIITALIGGRMLADNLEADLWLSPATFWILTVSASALVVLVLAGLLKRYKP